MAAMIVRQATSADAAALVAVLEVIAAERVHSAIERPWTVEQEARYVESLSPREAIHVAEEPGHGVIGFQSLDLWSPLLTSMAHVGQVGTFLLPEWRKRGIGRRLWEATAAFARAAGYGKLVIQVRASNIAAQQFYRGLGFRECGRLSAQVIIDGAADDEILMELNRLSPKSSFRIASLPGDGVGPDVVAAAIRVLRAVESGFSLQFDEFSVGAGEYLRSGDPLPAGTFERIKDFDAILLGAMGLPDVRYPGGVEMTPQLDLRERLDLYLGLRPIYLYHPDDSPLRTASRGIDLLLVRESTEGLFTSRLHPATGEDFVEDRMRITRRGAERVIRGAFHQARRRRRHVTLVDKANVLPSMAYFRRIFDQVAAEFPDVGADRVYVDAMSLYLVQNPSRFDVVVTENMFGDILSDLAAGLVGGMGM
ncbi:MAG TPA: hypothetical protein DEH78_06980, partial [Solibacterales bacterium]|nr:hypothetical protein [Bryobacterales bacterium]